MRKMISRAAQAVSACEPVLPWPEQRLDTAKGVDLGAQHPIFVNGRKLGLRPPFRVTIVCFRRPYLSIPVATPGEC